MSLINFISILSVIIIGIVLIVILIYLNRVISERIKYEKNKFLPYKKQIKNLNQKNPAKKDLEILNKTAREFFYKRFNFKYSLSYLQLIQGFKKEKNINKRGKYIQFCELMSELIYSGRKNDVKTKKAILLFSEILSYS